MQTTPNGRIGRLAHLNPNTQLPNAESQQGLFSENKQGEEDAWKPHILQP